MEIPLVCSDVYGKLRYMWTVVNKVVYTISTGQATLTWQEIPFEMHLTLSIDAQNSVAAS